MTKCNKCGEWWTAQCPVCFSLERTSGSLHRDCSAVAESAQDLESHARVLIKHRHSAPEWMWENLANSVNRLNAARQSYELSQLPNVEKSNDHNSKSAI